MLHYPYVTQNWSRAFTIWINDIQVSLPAQVVEHVVRGGFLRKVRIGTRSLSLLVIALFSLHCTQARAETLVPGHRHLPSVLPIPSAALAPTSMPYIEAGLASWYGDGDGFEDLETASGEPLNGALATCAHRTLPFGTLLQIEHVETGAQAVARVNDRGPFVKGRILDVTACVAQALGLRGRGVAPVRIRTLSGGVRVQPVIHPAPQPDATKPQPSTVAECLNYTATPSLHAPSKLFRSGLMTWMLAFVNVAADTKQQRRGLHQGRWPFLRKDD